MLLLLVGCTDHPPGLFSGDGPSPHTFALAPEDAGSGAATPSFAPPAPVPPSAVRSPFRARADAGGQAPGPSSAADGVTVVIGAGLAGLAAALDLPGRVIVLEAAPQAGGRATYAGGYMFLVDTPELDALGMSTSASDVLSSFEVLTGAPPSPATADYFEASGEVRDRLVDELGLTFALGHQDPVLHRFLQHHPDGNGPALVNAFLTALPPSVDLRLGVTVQGLEFEDGRITGVDLGEDVLPADRVVIASGGFVNRADLVERFAALDQGAWGVGTDDGARGAAVGWAQTYDLGLTHLDAIGWNNNVLGIADAAGAPVPVLRPSSPPWIWVNGDGERFVDESAGWSLTLAAQAAAQDHPRLIVAWESLRAEVDPILHPVLDDARTASVDVICAANAASLARATHLPIAGLTATIAATTTYLDGTATDPFGRPRSTFRPVDGELCAMPIGRMASKNYGGLATDLDGRVLWADGSVVPGLYAAGEAAGMGTPGVGGQFGFDGSLGAVIWSGWRVAATIARETQP